MSRRRNAVFCAAALVSFGCSAGVARAADDGYQDVFSSVLTAVGVLRADQSPEIDYRERAPLVLPPKMELAKPVPAGAARTAAWPQDPDVIKRRKADAEARMPSANVLGNVNNRMSKEELMKGRVAGTENMPEIAARRDACGNNGNARNCLLVNPDELKAMNERYQASGNGEKDQLVAGQEPDRMYLTQPPKGYLKTSRTVKATAEAPVPKIDESNPSAALVYRPKPDDE